MHRNKNLLFSLAFTFGGPGDPRGESTGESTSNEKRGSVIRRRNNVTAEGNALGRGTGTTRARRCAKREQLVEITETHRASHRAERYVGERQLKEKRFNRLYRMGIKRGVPRSWRVAAGRGSLSLSAPSRPTPPNGISPYLRFRSLYLPFSRERSFSTRATVGETHEPSSLGSNQTREDSNKDFVIANHGTKKKI